MKPIMVVQVESDFVTMVGRLETAEIASSKSLIQPLLCWSQLMPSTMKEGPKSSEDVFGNVKWEKAAAVEVEIGI